MVDARPHVVARFHLEGAQMHARAETVWVLQPVQVPHEVRDPRQLKLATDDLEVREAVQNAAKNKIIGEHPLDLAEEVKHATRVFTTLLRCLRLTRASGARIRPVRMCNAMGAPASSAT